MKVEKKALGIIAVCLLLGGLIVSDAAPFLRGPAVNTAEWFWPYAPRFVGGWWTAVLLAGALVLVVLAWQKTGRSLFLPLLILLTFALQIALVDPQRPLAELIDRTLSAQTSGYFEVAANTSDLNTLLRTYPQAMPDFPSEHPRTHPPGLLVAHWLTIRLLNHLPRLSQIIAAQVWPLRCTDLWLYAQPPAAVAALGVWAMLPALLGALTLWPLWGLASRLLEESAARLAVAFAATLPALLIFTPNSVQIDAFLAVTAVYCLHRALQEQKNRWFIVSGVALSLATFVSLGNAALVIPMGLYALFFPSARITLRQILLLGVASASVWLVYGLGWGVPPWSIARVGLAQHYSLVTAHRRYGWWLAYNWLDVVLFAGLPLCVGFVASLRQAGGLVWRLSTAVALLLLLLDVSGSARGEVGRLWLFLMPFLALGAAAYWGQMGRDGAWLMAAQLGLTLAIAIAWQPIRAVIVVAERPLLPAPSQPQTSLEAGFVEAGQTAPALSLTGYTLTTTETTVDVALFWQAAHPAQRPYTVFTHLVNANGDLVAQQDNWPLNGRWPPSCWQAGERLADPYSLTLPPDLPAGEYRLLVGWYEGENRLTSNGRTELLLQTLSFAP